MSARPASWLLALALSACHGARPVGPASSSVAPKSGVVASNVRFADYAGSQVCKKCHADIWEKWQRSPMHNMTRRLGGAGGPVRGTTVVHAPFAGEQLHFKNDLVAFEQHDGARFMRLTSREWGPDEGRGGRRPGTWSTQLFRVTKIIGGHHREDFVGIEVMEEAGLPEKSGARERVLPATWMIDAAAWRYKGYSVMTPERPGLRAGAVWSKTCIFCHNTEPYLSVLFGAISGPNTPPYQGEIVDALLPDAKKWAYLVTDPAAFSQAVSDEIVRLRGRGLSNATAADGVKATRAYFDERSLVEVGIGCESCHGGCAEHAKHPDLQPSLEPRSPFLAVTPPPALDAEARRAEGVTRVCARCHQVLFTQYPFTWEGEGRAAAHPGGAHINSGEARDFLLGGCTSRMTCLTCHDPHAFDNREKMAELDGAKGSAICQRCHTKYASAEAVRAHAHHDPAGAGGQCMGCHMPKKNMSLENRLGRYHRVGSPTEAVKVERDRPLECALCHAQKSVRAIVDQMEAWWGPDEGRGRRRRSQWNGRYDRAALERLYGSLDANVIRATIAMGKPHEQAAALGVIAEQTPVADANLLRLCAAQLTHPVPIVRYFAVRAVEALTKQPLSIDLFRDDAAIAADAAKITGSGSDVIPRAVGGPEPAAPDGEE